MHETLLLHSLQYPLSTHSAATHLVTPPSSPSALALFTAAATREILPPSLHHTPPPHCVATHLVTPSALALFTAAATRVKSASSLGTLARSLGVWTETGCVDSVWIQAL